MDKKYRNYINEIYRSNISMDTIRSTLSAQYDEPYVEAKIKFMTDRLNTIERFINKAKQVKVKIDREALMYQDVISPTETTSVIFGSRYSTKNYTIARFTPLAQKHDEVRQIVDDLIEGKITSHGAVIRVQEWKAKLTDEERARYKASSQ